MFQNVILHYWSVSCSHHSPPRHWGPGSREPRHTLRSSSGDRSHCRTDSWWQSSWFLTKPWDTVQHLVAGENPAVRHDETCEIHTLAAVELISSIGAVGLAITHKQWMQRTVASTVRHRPHCGDTVCMSVLKQILNNETIWLQSIKNTIGRKNT